MNPWAPNKHFATNSFRGRHGDRTISGKISHLRSDRCLFRAHTLANSSCVVLHYFLVLFCMSLLCFDVKISFLIYTYTHTPAKNRHASLRSSLISMFWAALCPSRASGSRWKGSCTESAAVGRSLTSEEQSI